jgi:tRNA threonylcarbamoyladenosine biosynthesis protein TsaB
MPLILNIETATRNCSVALAEGETVLAVKEAMDIDSHASLLNGFIADVLESSGKTMQQLDAVAVSNGPGSYTGLRIGLSTAKGLCYALDIPLITVNTLHSLASAMIAFAGDEDAVYIPLIDARRKEVYCGVFDSKENELMPVSPLVLEEDSFGDFGGKKYIAGSGTEKTIEILQNSELIFLKNVTFSAKSMVKKSNCFFKQNLFASVSYSEPEYLKPFYSNKNN